eukprot:TRINITY_DN13708_c0_g1_i1.p2 TRINITY_DN13708_c0_g1~~TRINITY_DN13708_c0_g1_i1.p2  ORF type:complete len:253 (+),score=-34.92 TRINITY_DN13708_c0_g1_i1:48-806(+)
MHFDPPVFHHKIVSNNQYLSIFFKFLSCYNYITNLYSRHIKTICMFTIKNIHTSIPNTHKINAAEINQYMPPQQINTKQNLSRLYKIYIQYIILTFIYQTNGNYLKFTFWKKIRYYFEQHKIQCSIHIFTAVTKQFQFEVQYRRIKHLSNICACIIYIRDTYQHIYHVCTNLPKIYQLLHQSKDKLSQKYQRQKINPILDIIGIIFGTIKETYFFLSYLQTAFANIKITNIKISLETKSLPKKEKTQKKLEK